MRAPVSPDACLPTVDDVLVHGANGVCGVPPALGQGAGPVVAPTALVIAVVVALVTAVLVRMPAGRLATLVPMRTPRARRIALASVALVSGLVGYRGIALSRADAPQKIAALGDQEATSLSAIDRLASTSPGCVRLPSATCPTCEPLVRFAAPLRAPCGHSFAHAGPPVDDDACRAPNASPACTARPSAAPRARTVVR